MAVSKVAQMWVEGEPVRAPEPQTVYDEVAREALHDHLDWRDFYREPPPSQEEL